MSTDTPSTVLLVGGPDAGKSNYLFRLWLALDGGNSMLVKDRLPDEVEYLRTGAESLLSGDFAGRTSKEVMEHASIPVKSVQDAGRTGVLNVPDVPGEKIVEVYRLRRWTELWESCIAAECGCLMFVRASSDEIVMPLDYAACVAAFGAPLPAHPSPPGGASGASSANPTGPAASSSSLSHPADQGITASETPTDVLLIDWLQFLRRAFTDRVGGHCRPRVGLVVAAWDAVPHDFQSCNPKHYLAENFPLVHQFMETNADRFDFQVFGVSILSGDLKNDAAFQAEYRQGVPQSFGYVVHSLTGELKKESDVTVPVTWAMGWFPTEGAKKDRI